MIERDYAGVCDASLLDEELIGAGLVKGDRFFGVSVDDSKTVVYVADDLTEVEAAIVDLTVKERHIRATPTIEPSLPSGAVLLFNRLYGDIPPGCLLCDGANGTPDLSSQSIQVFETINE